MSWQDNCVETTRNGKDLVLCRADGEARDLLITLPEAEYGRRLRVAQLTIHFAGGMHGGDLFEHVRAATRMFSSPDQYGPLPVAELYAYAAHIGAGVLDPEVIGDRQSVIAHTDMRHLGVPNPFFVHSVVANPAA